MNRREALVIGLLVVVAISGYGGFLYGKHTGFKSGYKSGDDTGYNRGITDGISSSQNAAGEKIAASDYDALKSDYDSLVNQYNTLARNYNLSLYKPITCNSNVYGLDRQYTSTTCY